MTPYIESLVVKDPCEFAGALHAVFIHHGPASAALPCSGLSWSIGCLAQVGDSTWLSRQEIIVVVATEQADPVCQEPAGYHVPRHERCRIHSRAAGRALRGD